MMISVTANVRSMSADIPGGVGPAFSMTPRVLAATGIPMVACLLIVTFAPALTVVGFELLGHRHAADAMARTLGESP